MRLLMPSKTKAAGTPKQRRGRPRRNKSTKRIVITLTVQVEDGPVFHELLAIPGTSGNRSRCVRTIELATLGMLVEDALNGRKPYPIVPAKANRIDKSAQQPAMFQLGACAEATRQPDILRMHISISDQDGPLFADMMATPKQSGSRRRCKRLLFLTLLGLLAEWGLSAAGSSNANYEKYTHGVQPRQGVLAAANAVPSSLTILDPDVLDDVALIGLLDGDPMAERGT
jgi:hypothetical protein